MSVVRTTNQQFIPLTLEVKTLLNRLGSSLLAEFKQGSCELKSKNDGSQKLAEIFSQAAELLNITPEDLKNTSKKEEMINLLALNLKLKGKTELVAKAFDLALPHFPNLST